MKYYYLNFYRHTPKGPNREWRRAFSSEALAIEYMVTLEPFEGDTFATVTEETRTRSRKQRRAEDANTEELFTGGG